VLHARVSGPALPVLVATLAMVAGGCGQSSSDDAVTLKLLMGAAENSRDEAAAEAIVDEFNEQHPDIRVERETVPVNELRAVLRTRLVSGEGPDVFTYDTGPGYGGVLAKTGLLFPLDDAYAEYGWEIYPWARARATYEGKAYGVPDSVEEVGVFYNADLFAELGLQPPETLDQLESIAGRVKQEGQIPFAFGDKDGWPGSHMFSMTSSNLLGRAGLDEILYGSGRWDEPKVVAAIDVFFRQFADRGYLPDGANGIGYDDSNALFYAGKAAMLPTGSWLVSDLTQKAPFKVGFFPFPAIDGSDVAPPAGVGTGYFVSARSERKDAAIEFLDYLADEDVAKRKIETLNIIPTFAVDTSGLDVSPLFKEVLTDLSAAGEGEEAFGYNLDVLTPASFNEVMYRGFQEVLGGDRTPEQQAAKLQAAWQEAKKAGEVLERP
jgi:raffinose/stachyose/melibiose transport system substrate-binding protein